MNKYDILLKSLKAYDDLTKIHEFLYQSADFTYDQECQTLEDLECTLLNLKDFVDHLLEKS